MADNVTADPGAAGAVFATDDIGSVHYPITKITIGALDSQTLLSGGNGTVDAGTVRVTVASDSTGVLSVDDNGGSLTVDNGGTFATQATLQAGTAEIGKLAAGVAEIGNVKNAGTFAVQIDAGAVTSLALIDDAIFVDDTATHATGTTKVMGIGAVATPTDGSVDANDIGMPAMSLDRRLHVDADITASVALDVSAATVTVSGTVTVTHPQLGGGTEAGAQRVTIANDSTGVVTVDGTITTVSTVTNLAQMGGVAISLNTGVRDTGTQRVTIATDDVVPASQSGTWNITNVSGTVSLPTGAATSANQSTAITALQLLDNPVVAHDAAVSGSTGVAILGLEARSTEPTAVANADATRGISTLLGKQVTIPYAIPASTWSYASPAAVTDTSDDVAKAAAGASIRNYITSIQVMNGDDTVGTAVVIKDGSTVIWQGWAEQTGGGCAAKFDPPLRGTANTAVNVANITTSAETFFNLQGYVALE